MAGATALNQFRHPVYAFTSAKPTVVLVPSVTSARQTPRWLG